jgi:hypothetical protein
VVESGHANADVGQPRLRGTLLLSSVLVVVIGVEALVAGLHVIGIAALLMAPAVALNYLYLRAVSATGTVRPVHLAARWAANLAYLAVLIPLCIYNLWRLTHHVDPGWFWVALDVLLTLFLALVAVRFVLAMRTIGLCRVPPLPVTAGRFQPPGETQTVLGGSPALRGVRRLPESRSRPSMASARKAS